MSITDEQKIIVKVAALLHDIGHGPFSHAFEKVTTDKHESRTLQIILDPDTEINKTLKEFSESLPDKVSAFFDEDVDETSDGAPSILTQIVSSQLDADRADYLLRDSHATGAQYGVFDLKWLLLQQKVDPDKKRLCVGKKAAAAAEAYVFARHHMYQTVYFHKTTRAAEVMLKLIFQRYSKILKEGKDPVPEVPNVIKSALKGEKIALSDYLQLDDYNVTEFFKACIRSEDETLRDLGQGLINRKLFKCIDVPDAARDRIDEFSTGVREFLNGENAEIDYVLVKDAPADTPYKPYDPDAAKTATMIYIEQPDGKSEEISKSREVLKSLTKQYSFMRYYFPEKYRDKIKEIATGTLLKGA